MKRTAPTRLSPPQVFATLFGLLLGTAGQVMAQHGEHNHRPHLHGQANLLVAQEENQLLIELSSPAMNLVGFEHRAETAEAKAQVASAKNKLADARDLFNTGAAGCELVAHEADFSAVMDSHTSRPGAHSNHDHSGHTNATHQQAADHSDITVHYQFHCAQPDKLHSLITTLPTRFPGVESLLVQWIVNGQQGQSVVDAQHRQVNFR